MELMRASGPCESPAHNFGVVWGDLREIVRKRSKCVKKTRGHLRKLEAKVKDMGGALSEEVSDGSSVLCDTSSDSGSDTASEDSKGEPSSASNNGNGRWSWSVSTCLRQKQLGCRTQDAG